VSIYLNLRFTHAVDLLKIYSFVQASMYLIMQKTRNNNYSSVELKKQPNKRIKNETIRTKCKRNIRLRNTHTHTKRFGKKIENKTLHQSYRLLYDR